MKEEEGKGQKGKGKRVPERDRRRRGNWLVVVVLNFILDRPTVRGEGQQRAEKREKSRNKWE
jgi:hypothetical protein